MNDPRIDSATLWTALALAADVPPAPAHLRDRVLAAADRAAPYRAHLAAFARCFDLAEAEVHRLLARMDDPSAWTPGFGATIAFLHFDAGPRCDAGPGRAHCGVARMMGGAFIPLHEHKAREVNFVLRGALIDGGGRRVGPGGLLESGPGSRHSLTIEGDPEALLVVMLPEVEMIADP